MPDLLRLCAFEGTQVRGDSLPLDAQSGAQGKLGFTLRVPCGIVVAITPFNYPVLLVIHKIGPALAAGNSVILKPATLTPLSALKLVELFLEAGLPEHGLQCITGAGSMVCPALCSDERVRKISFTGSASVGEQITRVAGIKKLSLELGSNAACVILDDADLEKTAELVAIGGLVNAGQVCISTQRVLVQDRVYGDFLDALKAPVEAFKMGDPFAEGCKISAMISEDEAGRVGDWVDEAVSAGARVVTGGEREGARFSPTVLADVQPTMRVCREELFGPAVAVAPFKSLDDAIAFTNDSVYGLAAGIFTQNITAAMRFAQSAETGNVMINWTPLWRADLMPYGGFKQSGIGKEGPRDAVREMTEVKTVVVHGLE
jgi:glyceraldehyde-3-phosphate dehydrogenase (NADP+)